MASASKDLTQGRPAKLLLAFALPMMVGSAFQQMYTMVDAAIIGRFMGVQALAAVGATGAITSLLVNLFMGLSVGASVTVAQHYGAGRYKDVSQSVHTTVALSMLGGIVIGILGIVLAKPLLAAMGTPERRMIFRVISQSGQRTATVERPAVVRFGTLSRAGSTMVKGPGQKASARS